MGKKIKSLVQMSNKDIRAKMNAVKDDSLVFSYQDYRDELRYRQDRKHSIVPWLVAITGLVALVCSVVTVWIGWVEYDSEKPKYTYELSGYNYGGELLISLRKRFFGLHDDPSSVVLVACLLPKDPTRRGNYNVYHLTEYDTAKDEWSYKKLPLVLDGEVYTTDDSLFNTMQEMAGHCHGNQDASILVRHNEKLLHFKWRDGTPLPPVRLGAANLTDYSLPDSGKHHDNPSDY